jgi:hypothetical protein
MSKAPSELAKLQRWFQVRTFAGPVKDAAREILPSRSLDANERLEIYSGMLPLRMQEALRADFPAVRAFLGGRSFERLVRDYVAKHPSRHPSLNHLGDHFPAFIAKGGGRVNRRVMVADVARLELAMTEVFDEKRAAPLDDGALARVPKDAWTRAKLRFVPAFRLLALDHPVNKLVTAARHEDPIPRVPKKKSWVAVYRKDWAVWRMDLTEEMHRVLSALLRGAPLARAIAASGIEDPATVFKWFRDWRAEGFFAAVVLPAKPKRGRRAAAC